LAKVAATLLMAKPGFFLIFATHLRRNGIVFQGFEAQFFVVKVLSIGNELP
jgi:hypothetical protein